MGDGNWWDPYCPCRVTRKNIVLTFLGICCLGLVSWTVIITGDSTTGLTKAVSYVFVDDSKSISNLNVSLSSMLILDAAEKAQEKKIAAVKAASEKAIANRRIILRTILEPFNSGSDNPEEVLCKCLCGMNVHPEEMLSAIMYLVEARTKGLNLSFCKSLIILHRKLGRVYCISRIVIRQDSNKSDNIVFEMGYLSFTFKKSLMIHWDEEMAFEKYISRIVKRQDSENNLTYVVYFFDVSYVIEEHVLEACKV